MSRKNPKIPKESIYFQASSTPEMSSYLIEVLVTKTTPHIGED
jgi:hypothetical protein